MNSVLKLSVHAHAGAVHAPFVAKLLKQAHQQLNHPLRELSLAFVGDRRMADLHVQFLQIPGPTDVLTFPLEHDARGRVIAGEVIVCVPEARRRCRETGIPLQHELLLYALHGMLHLSGFDDRTARDFAAMHRMEDQLLTKLGVGAVFNRSTEEPKKTKPRRNTGNS